MAISHGSSPAGLCLSAERRRRVPAGARSRGPAPRMCFFCSRARPGPAHKAPSPPTRPRPAHKAPPPSGLRAPESRPGTRACAVSRQHFLGTWAPRRLGGGGSAPGADGAGRARGSVALRPGLWTFVPWAFTGSPGGARRREGCAAVLARSSPSGAGRPEGVGSFDLGRGKGLELAPCCCCCVCVRPQISGGIWGT